MVETSVTDPDTVLAGPFRLLPRQRAVLRGDTPIHLGSRAREILFVLAERPGEIVGKAELLKRVWPDTIVEEGSLRFHIAALRRALADPDLAESPVQNVSGRGYRLIAPTARASAEPAARRSFAAQLSQPTVRLERVIGREAAIETLGQLIAERRLVTLAGPGGIGKTTVAMIVADDLAHAFADGAVIVDLAPLSSSERILDALVSQLACPQTPAGALADILACLRERQTLLVLDNCEHVVAEVAALVERILGQAPRVRILCTSREPVMAAGEWVHRLGPLDSPPPAAPATAAEALVFPAVELFADRAAAQAASFVLADEDVAAVSELCRRLDGNPLAIELAAARVELFGVRGLASRLNDQLKLLTGGKRTAASRQRTMRATLDWSYGLLTPGEALAFRRLSVFSGSFDLDAALAVAAHGGLTEEEVFDGLASLAAKSLLIKDADSQALLYRLLEIPRAYAREHLAAEGELEAMQRRLAELCCAWFEPVADEAVRPRPRIEDVRAALEWCFSAGGEAALGVRLAASSAVLWRELALLREYREHLSSAIAALEAGQGSDRRLLLRLHAELGDALLHTQGLVTACAEAFHRTLELCRELDEPAYYPRALWGVWLEAVITGHYALAVDYAEQFERYAADLGPEAVGLGQWMMSGAHHYAGDLDLARQYGEAAPRLPIRAAAAVSSSAFQLVQVPRILWQQGLADQAAAQAAADLVDPTIAGHAVSFAYALTSSGCIALWRGDDAEARRITDLMLAFTTRHALGNWHAWARRLESALDVRAGRLSPAEALELLEDEAAGPLHAEFAATFSIELLTPLALARAEQGLAGWSTAEIWRADGEHRARSGDVTGARAAFLKAFETAEAAGALGWSLRAAISLVTHDPSAENRLRLVTTYERFTEGFATADLRRARELLGRPA